MKRLGLGALVGALGLLVAGVALELMLENGFSARDEPTVVDAFVARWWRRLAVPAGEKSGRNPLPATPEVLARGREHFAVDCAACHGSDGRGGTRLAEGLYPKPPDLTGAGTQSLSDAEIFWVVQNGVRLSGMPAFGRDTDESDQWTWEIARFVRELPRMSPQDVEAVEALRPRGPRQVEQELAARRFLGEPQKRASPPEDAHDEVTLMGRVAAASALRLQVRMSQGPSVSFLLDHPKPTTVVRGTEQATVSDIRVGDRVAVRAVRDQDWWLAREVRLPRADRKR